MGCREEALNRHTINIYIYNYRRHLPMRVQACLRSSVTVCGNARCAVGFPEHLECTHVKAVRWVCRTTCF